MKTFIATLALAALSLTAFAGTPPTTKPAKATAFKVNTEASSILWLAKKVTGEHSGTVKFNSGSIETKGTTFTGGTFSVNMESMLVTDIKDPTYNGKLLGHLKGQDFFDVTNHKTSTLVVKSVKPGAEKNSYDVTADLTIKGITKPVTFPATVTIAGDKVTALAKVTIDRTSYDVKYGSLKFFADLADKAIYDDFVLDLNVIAGK